MDQKTINMILLILNLIISFLTPLLMAVIQIFKKARKLKCCGSESVLSPENSLHLEKREDNIKDIAEVIKRLSINNNKNKSIDL